MTQPVLTQLSFSLGAAFALLFGSGVCATDSDLKYFPNINYVGTGYDILKGNPHPANNAGSNGEDPGWRTRLFEITYGDVDRSMRIDDEMWALPDGIEVHECNTCSFEWSTSDIMSANQYKESLGVKASADFSGWGASFKASADYKSVEERHQNSKTFFMESTGECSFYCPKVKEFAPPPFTDNFINAVTQLPVEFNRVQYERFIKSIGTHIADSLTMGAVYGVQHEINLLEYENMKSTGLDVKAAASYSALAFSGNLNAELSEEKEMADEFSSRTESQRHFEYGGRPTSQAGDPKNTTEWYNVAKTKPLPIKYRLIPVSNMLTAANFPNDEDIIKKQNNVNLALERYCGYLQEQGAIECFDRADNIPSYQIVDLPPMFELTEDQIRLYGPTYTEFSQKQQWIDLNKPLLSKLKIYYYKDDEICGIQAHYEGGSALPLVGHIQNDNDYDWFVLNGTTNERMQRIELCSKKGNVGGSPKMSYFVNFLRIQTQFQEYEFGPKDVGSSVSTQALSVDMAGMVCTPFNVITPLSMLYFHGATFVNGAFGDMIVNLGVSVYHETPTPAVTLAPTPKPTDYPTFAPTHHPSPAPTAVPTLSPSPSPTSIPTSSPTSAPTSAPTAEPTPTPTFSPTNVPTFAPTVAPIPSPTSSPTPSPQTHHDDDDDDDDNDGDDGHEIPHGESPSSNDSSIPSWIYVVLACAGGVLVAVVVVAVFLLRRKSERSASSHESPVQEVVDIGV